MVKSWGFSAKFCLLGFTAAFGTDASPAPIDPAGQRASTVLDDFVTAMHVCGVRPVNLPRLVMKTAPYLSSYFNDDNTIRLSRWHELPQPVESLMTDWAKQGTLKLAPPEMFGEIFNSLLVPHEMGHYLKYQSGRSKTLDHWQSEIEADQIAIAFWSLTPNGKASIANRVSNFERFLGTLPNPVPGGADPHAYFEANYDRLGSDPGAYGWYQGAFMRTAWADRSERDFCGWITLNR
jgi:hypothetical protein